MAGRPSPRCHSSAICSHPAGMEDPQLKKLFTSKETESKGSYKGPFPGPIPPWQGRSSSPHLTRNDPAATISIRKEPRLFPTTWRLWLLSQIQRRSERLSRTLAGGSKNPALTQSL